MPTTRSCSSRKTRSSARSTRISRSRAWPATSSSSAIPPTASGASSAARSASRTPRAWRRTSRSGSARRRAAPTSCRSRCRACAPKSPPALSPRSPRGDRHSRLADRARSASPSRAARARSSNIWLSGRGRARRLADPRDARHRAVLRRGRRHAAGHPFALWQPAQSRLGIGAAQALLPQVQFRAAGGGDRGQHRAVADQGAQLRSRRSPALPAFRTACGGC